MLNGNYNLTMDSPMGQITGKLTLDVINGSVSGILETMGMKNEFSGGKLISNTQCKISDSIKTPIGNINYDILATLNGNDLEIVADTTKGKLYIKGTKI